MSTTTDEALELVHHHPGRLRVRAAVFRGEGGGAASLTAKARQAVLDLPGVLDFQHNARTGSVLISYEPGVADPDDVLSHLAAAAGICPVPPGSLTGPRTPALFAVEAVQELNAIAAELTGRRADLRSLVPAGLAALSAYAFATSKEPRMPRWDNLLWWSYSVFLAHHGEEIADVAEERRSARRTAIAPKPATAT